MENYVQGKTMNCDYLVMYLKKKQKQLHYSIGGSGYVRRKYFEL